MLQRQLEQWEELRGAGVQGLCPCPVPVLSEELLLP